MTMKTTLTIAGSDCSGGAGIQADIKTITMHGVYAMSAITACTAQNTTGVKQIAESSPDFLQEQLDAVFEDIYPDAVKIGMLPSPKLIRITAERLRYYHAKNIILDPVMTASSGSSLVLSDTVHTLTEELFPMAALVTPNILEAQILSGLHIQDENTMLAAAKKLYALYGCTVLIKGGHNQNDANDILFDGGDPVMFYGRRIDNPNTHGTGCTLSSAIAANLAKGLPMTEAIRQAKEYLSNALAAMLDLGKGAGPMNHAFCLS